MGTADANEVVLAIERPHSNLLIYYAVFSLILGPFFPFLLVPLFLRYRTLHYRFDDEGVSMRWGMLFHKEISLTYTRVQDIHLASNAIERYLGLARVQVQTASGTSKAEMTIEGLLEYEQIRDFLYSRMRGVRSSQNGAETGPPEAATSPTPAGGSSSGELAAVLSAVAAEVAALRRDLGERAAAPGSSRSEE